LYTYEHLGILLIKISDVYGKNIDLDNGLEAYNASQLCYNLQLYIQIMTT
jgi:hypothetical protein